ncbi:hypothetical protein P7C73_g3402, partial [Tremellales sp. Uapishka_1]
MTSASSAAANGAMTTSGTATGEAGTRSTESTSTAKRITMAPESKHYWTWATYKKSERLKVLSNEQERRFITAVRGHRARTSICSSQSQREEAATSALQDQINISTAGGHTLSMDELDELSEQLSHHIRFIHSNALPGLWERICRLAGMYQDVSDKLEVQPLCSPLTSFVTHHLSPYLEGKISWTMSPCQAVLLHSFTPTFYFHLTLSPSFSSNPLLPQSTMTYTDPENHPLSPDVQDALDAAKLDIARISPLRSNATRDAIAHNHRCAATYALSRTDRYDFERELIAYLEAKNRSLAKLKIYLALLSIAVLALIIVPVVLVIQHKSKDQ